MIGIEKRKTFVSLGMSCQTSHQLRRLTKTHDTVVDDSSADSVQTGLFDWLICPPASTIKLLDDHIPDFTRESIQVHKSRAYWAGYNLYFWHGFYITEHEQRCLSIDDTFARELERWRYLRDRFSNIDPQQTLFVLSNTQNNLSTEVFDKTEIDQYHFSQTIVKELHQSLARYFKCTTGNVHLKVLSRPERFNGPIDKTTTCFLPPDHNEWKGSKKSWDLWWQQQCK